MQVELLASAVADIRQEKAFYRKINRRLAVQFQVSVENAVQAAAADPLAMQALEVEIRRWPLKGFPHGVMYRVEADFILVLSVFHPSQQPGKVAIEGTHTAMPSTRTSTSPLRSKLAACDG